MRARILVASCAALLCACASVPDPRALWQTWGPGNADPLLLKDQPPAGLPSPEGLRAESGGFRAVRLEWEPLLAGSVGGYVVERAPEREGPYLRLAVRPGRFSTVYVDPTDAPPDGIGPLGDGAIAFYRVRAFAPSGHLASAVSDPILATTAPAPAAPADLRAFSLQPRMVPLRWSASGDTSVGGYVVERSPSSRGPFETIARIDSRLSTAWVDRGLGDLRVLYYRVAAFNAAGVAGPPTAAVRAVTKPEPLPPYRLRVSEQRLGQVRLVWDPNVEADVAGYRLLRQRDGSDEQEPIGSFAPDETEALDTDVAAAEKLSYSLVAVDRDGLESEPAVPIALESEGYGLRARVEEGRVELHWNSRRDEGWERARIQRSGRLQTRDLGVVDDGEFVDTDVAPGGRYVYTIVLERGDLVRAPPSRPVEVVLPPS